MQLQEYVKPEHIFTEYAYFSSYSTSWVEHARKYCHMIKDRLGLGSASQVFEIASNDGYLLQHFLPLGIPVIGIEPAANVAEAARAKEYSDARRVLRLEARASALSPRGGEPISSSATMCWRRFPISTTSRQEWRICWPRTA